MRAGRPLDETVLRSYCAGAAHMAYSWVTSECLGVDPQGTVHDLTVRSFGIVSAANMPAVKMEVLDDGSEPVNGSEGGVRCGGRRGVDRPGTAAYLADRIFDWSLERRDGGSGRCG